MRRRMLLAALVAMAAALAADEKAYDIGKDLGESFWKSDPVLFVKRHEKQGFQFTSGSREGADTRLDGAVVFHGTPVYETKVSFGEAGGISRVELMLCGTAGTEREEIISTGDGHKLRRRVRTDKTISRDEFVQMIKDVRDKLTPKGAKSPEMETDRVAKSNVVQKSQTWPKTAIPTVAKLTWNYTQKGNRKD